MTTTPVASRRRPAEPVDMEALDVDESKAELTYLPTKSNLKALGLRPFVVIRATIKDSLGRYVGEDAKVTEDEEGGNIAYLDKASAQRYLDLNYIRVELPEDFANADTDTGAGNSSET